ncbi:prepilin-type N-terminal cleavage/methylation domain-containing protein [Demequina sp. NBRC 110056]|uniref:type IV pilus modification PilV family protein n=1 Tax=Demequina sp. NBRC 110056 TaxID=1570345 RepID=UPI0009FB951F|nr:prepilin-type N-terminal cleavage/methylation domain-containing protein [Demequina sp. NBRC 110056]
MRVLSHRPAAVFTHGATIVVSNPHIVNEVENQLRGARNVAKPNAERQRDFDAPEHDAGFTLVEVMAALFILSLVSLAFLALFLSGVSKTSDLQRQQAAVGIANSAMDSVRSVAGGAVNATGTAGIVKGRSYSAVQTVWDAADPADTVDMNPVSDPDPGLEQWVPVRDTAFVDGQEYTIDTLIGSCYRLRAASTISQDCVKANPGGTNYIQMYRVRVVVSWDTGSGEQSYRLTSLVDPSGDPTWNTVVGPFAYDDEFSVDANATPSFHAIVSNDTVEYDETGSSSPIRGLSSVSPGGFGASVGVQTARGIDGVVFDPPNDHSGTMTFTYGVRSSAGEESAVPATVTVRVLPNPDADALFVEPSTTTVINDELLDGDRGVNTMSAGESIRIVPVLDTSVDMFGLEPEPETVAAREQDAQDLRDIGVSVDGAGNVSFAAPDTENVTTRFYYYLVNESADNVLPSRTPVEVTLTTQVRPLEVNDFELEFDAATGDVWHPIDWRDETGNEDDIRIRILNADDADLAGLLDLDGSAPGTGSDPAPGEELEFLAAASTIGTYEIEYEVVSPGDRASDDTATITIRVVPTASNVTHPEVRRSTTTDMRLSNVGVPASGMRVVVAGQPTSQCGSATAVSNDFVRYQAPYWNGGSQTRNCSFTYRLVSLTDPTLVSDEATVSVRVRR